MFKYSQHEQVSRSRNLKNIITAVILLQFQSFFSRVDFSYLPCITSLLFSPVSVEFGSLSPSGSVNRGSYIMIPVPHSFFHSQICIKDWTRHSLMCWKYRNAIEWEGGRGKDGEWQRYTQRDPTCLEEANVICSHWLELYWCWIQAWSHSTLALDAGMPFWMCPECLKMQLEKERDQILL